MTQVIFQRTALSPRQLCRGLGLAWGSFQRWSERQRQAQPLIQPAGPRKVGPLPMEKLLADLDGLVHRAQRTRGTGELQAHWHPFIARGPLQNVVTACRRAKLRARRQRLQRIRWLQPNVAWAIDATEYPKDAQADRLVHVVVQDLASTFQFDPLLKSNFSGHDAATLLHQLFRRHGPPLFLKRDNGGVFNTPEVDALLAQFAVIPLNSPTRYPRYNGAIEHGIGELKHDLHGCLPRPTPSAPSAALPFARFLVHKHNYQPRRLLGGQSATQAYFQRPPLRWNRGERHRIFAWLGARAKRMLRAMDHPNQRDLRRSWRRAAESWLRRQGLIKVSINQQTVTPFSPKMVS